MLIRKPNVPSGGKQRIYSGVNNAGSYSVHGGISRGGKFSFQFSVPGF